MSGSMTESPVGSGTGTWAVRNLPWLKSSIRIIFGAAWLIDGYLKFLPGMADALPGFIITARYGQPAWLQPWFNFWAMTAASNETILAYTIGPLEVALGLALILGFMRKLVYIGGAVFSFLIWAVPEGFGGPYTAGHTDVGTGIIYSFVFLALIVINATSGPSRISVDYFIERHYSFWRSLAEFRT